LSVFRFARGFHHETLELAAVGRWLVRRAAFINRVSYNGGTGGTEVQPTAEQQAFAREGHIAPTAAQVRQERVAMNNPAQRFSANRGRPQIAATAKPGAFNGPGVVRANAKGHYAYRPVPRDRAAYRSQYRTDARAEAPRENPSPGMERRAYGEPRPQKQSHNPRRKRHPCCRMPS
ncbi:MAG: hypothetical protein KGJ17_07275, partial [Gammaproteobacteria bacterium]|nr:hypothetical protein [Gammaproteobacteria bacterium]